MKTIEHRFKTWSEYVDQAESGVSTLPNDESSALDTDKWRKDWTKTKGMPEAIKLARQGWPEGAKKAKAIAEPIEHKVGQLIEMPLITYDVTGELLDIARFCGNEPEHWGNWQSELREGQGTKHLHLVLNGGLHCDADPDAYIARGGVVGALVNLLELGGRRVKVSVAMVSDSSGGNKFRVYIPVKDYDEFLDLDRLVYAIAHPAVCRRMFLRLLEQLDKDMRDVFGAHKGGGYGRPGEIPSTERGDIYIEPITHKVEAAKWTDPARAEQWVMEQLTTQGVLSVSQ